MLKMADVSESASPATRDDIALPVDRILTREGKEIQGIAG
jgi:hypothetical protein